MADEIETGGAGPRIQSSDDFAKWLEEARPAMDVCVALAARAALRALPFIIYQELKDEVDANKATIKAASRLFRATGTSLSVANYPHRMKEFLFNLYTALNAALAETSSSDIINSNLLWSVVNAAKAAKSLYSDSPVDPALYDSLLTHDASHLTFDDLYGSSLPKETFNAVRDATEGILIINKNQELGIEANRSAWASSWGNSWGISWGGDAPHVSSSNYSSKVIMEKVIWLAVELDVKVVLAGALARQLTSKPLWHDASHPFIMDSWRRLARTLPDSDNWQVWKNWYEDILKGTAHGEAHDMIYATVPEEEWEKGPAAANAWIAAKLAELEAKTSTYPLNDFPEVVAQENQATHEKDGPVDFFISYEKEDVGFARFVDSVLRKAGYRVFVQFRDMPTGSDFLVEMNKGLSEASRFIAILSPRYNKSKMCQAEWNAAYHADPDGEKRTIVQYLVEATDLLPLARSRVYKSLVGLSQAQATEAILDAIGSKISVDTDVAWPGAEALDHMAQATKPLFDVALDDKRQLAPVANHSLNQETERLYGFSAENLYMDMREAIQDYTEYVCNTRKGNFAFSSSIQHTARKLLEKTHEDWKKSNPLAINRALIHTLMALENADRNGDLPSGDINYHQNELRGMHQRLIQIFPNLEQFREKARFERYVEPELKALEAQTDILLKTAADSIVTSPKLANILRDSQASLDELRELLLPETAKETRRKDLYEEHKSIATQIVPVWNWIVNAGAKISKTGDDMSKTIENFEKLSKRIDTARDYFDWLSKWFY